ncbi:MAG TPA: hypothetical protein DCR14_05100 [Acidimicrobiaceae bacterium]|nr:hypothetical protein [Acidimicrobiaceae bacterium]
MNASVVRFCATAGALGAALLLSAPAVSAADTSVQADVHCDASNEGVVDITLINDGQSMAVFQVDGAAHSVAAGSAYALTYTGVEDGAFILPITADGADATVRVSVDCEAPQVQVAPGQLESFALPSAGSETTWAAAIAAGLVASGAAALFAARRRYS